MKKKLLAAIFGSVLVLGACGGGDDETKEEKPDSGGDVAVVDAEAVVNKTCITCHGGNLEGGKGPALDKIGAELSEDEIHDIIINGKNGEIGNMPAGLIKGEEADAVAKWLSEKK